MPQMITRRSLFAFALLLPCLLALSGCGEGNPQSTLDPETGKHPAAWVPAGHIPEALQHMDSCMGCHGNSLTGGTSKVACSQCHVTTLTTAGFSSVHPLDWDNFVYVRHAAYVRQNGTGFCASTFCHGTGLNGGPGPSCSSCHIGGPTMVHPAGWNTPQDLASPHPLHSVYVFTNGGTASCRNVTCHGSQLQGVLLSGPACSICHGASVANFPQ